jgi:hypothetical protein
MEKIKYTFIMLLFVLGCSGVRVTQTERAPGFSLPAYQTFAFYEVTTGGDLADQPYFRQVDLLKSAIQQELTAKGLTYATSNPDLLVNIGVVTREKVQTRETNFRTDAPRYIGQRRYSWKSQEVEVGRYKEGSVTVDLVDRQQDARVWTGTVEAIIPDKETRQQKTITAGMAKLFESL